jgi:hypothetical protein
VIGFLLGIPGKIKIYCAAILAAFAGAFALYAKGRADASAKRKAAEAARKIKTLETAREVQDDVAEKSDADVRRDLSKWVRSGD